MTIHVSIRSSKTDRQPCRLTSYLQSLSGQAFSELEDCFTKIKHKIDNSNCKDSNKILTRYKIMRDSM